MLFPPTLQHKKALNSIDAWNEKPIRQTYTLGGYAGTGKTTLIPEIRDSIHPNSAVVTYTNKAAAVLRSKGIWDATTIFRLMYKLLDPVAMTWQRVSILPVDFVIVDEASMLGRKMREDLESYGEQVLYVGDPFQLPPIKEESVMDNCDFTLTEVLRHGDEILDIATAIRQGKRYPDVDQYTLTDTQICDADIIICLSNEKRFALNQRVRKHLGRTGQPQKGDRVMSAKTNYDFGIFAGETGTMVSTNNRRRYEVLFDGWDDTVVFTNGYFLQAPKENPYSEELRGRSCLDYAHAMTCHKAQGSQYDRVIVWEEARADARWKYTAATRAVKKLTMAGR